MFGTNFYNLNEFRDYPFLDRTTGMESGNPLNQLPRNVILDAQFVYIGESSVKYPIVKLVSVYCLGVEPLTLELTFQLESDEYKFVFSELTPKYSKHSLVSGAGRGYLVFGSLDDIPSDWKNTSLMISGSIDMEPTRVLWLKDVGVSSVTIGNANRCRATYPKDCPEPDPDFDEELPLNWKGMDPNRGYWNQPLPVLPENLRPIRGKPLILKEGYNCTLTLDQPNNRVIVYPATGAGMGVVGKDVSLGYYRTVNSVMREQLPLDPLRQNYSGSIDLVHTIRLINQATGPDTYLEPRGAVSVVISGSNSVFVSMLGVKGGGGCGYD